MSRIAIIAGAGPVPARAAEKARELGREPLLFALVETGADTDLAAEGAAFEPASIGKPQALLDRMKEAGADEVLIVGKVPKQLHFEDLEFDERALSILGRLQSRADANLFAALADELAGEGIAVAGQSEYLAEYRVPAGVLCGAFDEAEREAAARALSLAREIARLDVGQTVCVKNGLTVAVEAAEHTDETIRRAGSLAGDGLWVAKAARPGQDDRFDVPSIGEQTINTMAEVHASLLIVEAGAVFLFERDRVVAAADAAGITVVAFA